MYHVLKSNAMHNLVDFNILFMYPWELYFNGKIPSIPKVLSQNWDILVSCLDHVHNLEFD